MEFTYSRKQLEAYDKSFTNLTNVSHKVKEVNSSISLYTSKMLDAKGGNVSFIGEKLHEDIDELIKAKELHNKVKGLYDVHLLILEGHTHNINKILPRKGFDSIPKKVEIILTKSTHGFKAGIKYEVFLTTKNTSCQAYHENKCSRTGFTPMPVRFRHKYISFISDEKYIEKVWRTFSGALIPASQLSHQHLSNIIHYYNIIIGRDHKFAIQELVTRFGGVMLPYRPTIDFRSEINALVELGYTDGKPNSPIIINGKTIGNIRYD